MDSVELTHKQKYRKDYYQQNKERELARVHCHRTGKKRGLLCGRCNTGIGLLHDDKEIVLAAAKYLEDTGQSDA